MTSVYLTLFVFGLIAGSLVHGLDGPFSWLFPSSTSLDKDNKSNQLERETQQNIHNIANEPSNSALFKSAQSLRSQVIKTVQNSEDKFQCVDPSRLLFDHFVTQYNRTFESGNAEKLERLNLFYNTIKRAILLNRIIQNDVFNRTNYDLKPQIRNYHFISALNGENLNFWYADINDCELGLIKYIIFQIFYLIDDQNLPAAYKMLLDNKDHLPLLNSQGFQQLSEILLIRLFERVKGDEKINKLFEWPLYIKKLASYVYNRIQANQPNFKAKMALISFAYPAYFKDLKYNERAINRTKDNELAHEEHEQFNKLMRRKLTNNKERNKRLVIFRERATLLRLLNEAPNSWLNFSQQPEWNRFRKYSDLHDSLTNPNSNSNANHNQYQYNSDGIVANGYNSGMTNDQLASSIHSQRLTKSLNSQYSDLTDAEFVAYLTNDYSILDYNKESMEFIEQNFPIRPLGESLRNELAYEILLRRTIQEHLGPQSSNDYASQRDQTAQQQSPIRLARQVIDELISDVGLPIGQVMLNSISETEYHSQFTKLGDMFGKIYASSTSRRSNQPNYLPTPDDSQMSDEKVQRYKLFKTNYARFKAWFIKEQWTLDDENQQLAMLRLADMSWHEIKVTLFKLCCLGPDQLAALAAENSTLHYLASNSFLCNPVDHIAADNSNPWKRPSEQLNQFGNQIELQQSPDELVALELYYYYSVHFNKHHIDTESFNASFAIFRSNIEQIRRLSCTRSLTIYRSLKLKRLDTLNTMDVLDPRRSYTDDINLDRFKYFSVPKLDGSPYGNNRQQPTRLDEYEHTDIEHRQQSQQGFERLRSANDQSRAGVSYRRATVFAGLVDERARASQLVGNSDKQPKVPQYAAYVDRLTALGENALISAKSYRDNNVNRIYELVRQRYRLCMKLKNVQPDETELKRLQCQPTGRFVDQAAVPTWTQYDNELSISARLQNRRQDSCDDYWMGLDAWGEGLLSQFEASPNLIQAAKC